MNARRRRWSHHPREAREINVSLGLALGSVLAGTARWVVLRRYRARGVVDSSGAIYELFTGALSFGTALAFLAVLGMPLIFAAC